MNKQAYTIIAAILIASCLDAPAKAQCGTIQSVANIPFQFSLDQKTLPAGQYRVTCADSGYGSAVIRLTGAHASVAVATVTVNGKPKEHARLVFHRRGNRYFLAQVWAGGEEVGLEVPKSRTEREVERELASIKPNNETVALITRR